MTRVLQALAIVCLALAIAAVAAGIDATLAAGRLQGPSALVVTPQREVWIGVDDALWRADADGALLETRAFGAIGLPGRPANLLHHPGGAIVATVKDDPTLYCIDPLTLSVVRSVRPRWPSDLARHGGRAINLALHPDGRIAIATGGGHAVAVFHAQGELLARSAPDLYRFTNGLWWSGDSLWTTDTNRFALKRLDGHTLELLQTVQLPAHAGGAYLGPARPHPAAGAGARDGPMAALVRFANGMIAGRVVVLGADGAEAASLHRSGMEPMDLDWLNGELLVSDAVSQSVLRWSAAGEPRPVFGDADLRSRLAGITTQRDRLQRRYGVGLGTAALTFAVGLTFALLAERRRQRQRREQHGLDLSRLGTPQLGWRPMLRLRLRAFGGLLLFAPLLVGVQLAVPALAQRFGARGLLALAVALVAMLALLLPWQLGRLRRQSESAEFEPLFNEMALRKLRRSDALALALRDGEHALETMVLQRATWRWIVLTNERLLVFIGNLRDHRLESSHALRDVVGASTLPGSLSPGRVPGRWPARFGLAGWLEIAWRDGSLLAGAVQAPTVARRVVEQLLRQAGIQPSAAAVPAAQRRGPPPRYAALGSALLPGLGQWLQGRAGSALSMFLPWLVFVTALGIPVLWGLAGPRWETSPATLASVAASHLLLAALAAWDAWRMAPR